ncbi:hypothetical protein [Microbacterium sp. 18062]|uniref:hypothetical protein n=1 Tax=Microbacterium sp. 18062 TaxID=2681410 RepID=UPI001359DF7A|nr:hypothetical protein [Microbacterium sp. 18062]
MSEVERVFIATVAQVVPVLLLALVVETRFFRFTHADAIPSVKDARQALHEDMSGFDYWGWRTLTSFRRWGLGISLTSGLVVVLAAVEVFALYLLAHDLPVTGGVSNLLIGGITIGVLAVGVLPVLGVIVRRNVELNQLELEVQRAVEAKRKRDAEEERARAAMQAARSRRRRWICWFPRR